MVKKIRLKLGLSSRILHSRVSDLAGRTHRNVFLLSAPPPHNYRLHTTFCVVSVILTVFRNISARNLIRETLLMLESLFVVKNNP